MPKKKGDPGRVTPDTLKRKGWDIRLVTTHSREEEDMQAVLSPPKAGTSASIPEPPPEHSPEGENFACILIIQHRSGGGLPYDSWEYLHDLGLVEGRLATPDGLYYTGVLADGWRKTKKGNDLTFYYGPAGVWFAQSTKGDTPHLLVLNNA